MEVLAAKQRGHLSRAQARAIGVSDDQIYRSVRSKGWREIVPGVLRLPGAPGGRRSDLVAVQLWLDQRGHFFGSTAAQIMNLQGVRPSGKIEVALRSGGTLRNVRTYRLRADDVPPTRLVDGFRVPRTERILL